MCARFCNENSRHRSRFSRELTFLVMAFFGRRHLRCSEYFWGKILAMFYEAHQNNEKNASFRTEGTFYFCRRKRL